MKICLGKELVEEIKKKDSENEKNLLKNRNSDEFNELDDDDVYFHSGTIKNIKIGSNTVNRVYLNNSIVYELQDTIIATKFHALVPKTATEIRFLYSSNNPDLTGYQRVGYADNNNFIEVWNNGTKYILINPSKNYIYAPTSCSYLFSDYTALSVCIFDNFDTRNVTNMEYMFYYCTALTSLDVSNFSTQNVTNMHRMFAGCTVLTSLDLSNFKTQNVTNMQNMFSNCLKLTSLDVSNFKTDNVTNMYAMFYGCNNLITLDLSSFNTEKVTTMGEMFFTCNALTSLDVSNFNTQNVTNMSQMFRACYAITCLNLSSFDTQNVTIMQNMFYNDSRLHTIISNTFNINSLTTSEYMFYGCTSLVGGNGTTYSSSHTNAEYARIDGENGLPGYFTAPTTAANNK